MTAGPAGADFRALRWVRGLGTRLRQPAVRSLLYALASHANGELLAWPSERTMVAEAGVARSSVQMLLPQLCDWKVLELATPARGTRPARYRFTLRDYDGLPAHLDNHHQHSPATGPVTGPLSGPPTGPGAEGASGPPGDASGPPGDASGPPTGPEVPEVPEGTTTGGAAGTGEGVDRAPPPPQAAARSGNGKPERLVPAEVWEQLGGRPDSPTVQAADRARLAQARAELAARAARRGAVQPPLVHVHEGGADPPADAPAEPEADSAEPAEPAEAAR